MSELRIPWLEISILLPLVGAICVGRFQKSDLARKWSVVISGLTLISAFGAWRDFNLLQASEASDAWHLISRLAGREILVMDQLSAPLLPWVALLYFLTASATLRTKLRRFSFAWMLASEAIVLATFSCREPWVIIVLLAAGTVPPYLELLARRKPTRVYLLHMALFVGLLVIGWTFVESEGGRAHTLWAILPLLAAVLVRSGIAPFHCWMTDLFEHATFGTALLFVTPIVGAYAAARLVLPIAPDWVLRSIGLMSLITAVYAAGMALVQKEARRLFCYIFLSHSALVLVGLEMVTPIGLTGALCVWLSVGLAMCGFGLTLRALEARRGRLSLAAYQGLFDHTPGLAMCFGLTGLASIGFPGTFGFVGTELLVDGAVETYPYVGVAVVVAAALNGIAVVQTYFRLFTGTQYFSTVSLRIGVRERYAVLTLAALILLGGLVPQPGVASRHRAAEQLLEERAALATRSKSYVDWSAAARAPERPD
jgi:NADH-quinone oxidoreductase subunit M